MTSLYWHDYETWGDNPALDRPAQFAGVRTDEALNIVGEPLCIYCKPGEDFLPKPEACLVTGITPQVAMARGVSEREFIGRIHDELSRPGTCGVGYNSIRFDDEVTRYALYRNFYDPYEREWRNGCSRWDIIDMVRLTYALRPHSLRWPLNEDGSPSFRLEKLSAENGLLHESAHDALSDVYATIALAKLIRDREANLFAYAFRMRAKKEVASLIDFTSRKPLLHISSRYAARNGCAALVSPIAPHPKNQNGVIVFDLSASPSMLAELSVDQICERLYTKREDLEEGVERVPLKVVHLNKSPVLVTPKLLDAAATQRLNIDKAQCEKNWQALRFLDIGEKIQAVFERNGFSESTDPDTQLYQGFLNDKDKATLADVRKADGETLASTSFSFYDRRLPELLFRYRARNFPQQLSPAEQSQWREFCQQRLADPAAGGSLTFTEFCTRIDALLSSDLSTDKRQVLLDLKRYGEDLVAGLGIV